MTRVSFYFNAADKLDAARKLAIKAYQAGQRTLLYTGDAAVAQQLDQSLWMQPALSFVPHVHCDHPLAAVTPVLIGANPEPMPAHDVLINLEPDWPPCFARFERLIELVGADEADKALGRTRWQFYKARGYALDKVDLAEAGR